MPLAHEPVLESQGTAAFELQISIIMSLTNNIGKGSRKRARVVSVPCLRYVNIFLSTAFIEEIFNYSVEKGVKGLDN